eukprot:scaffold5.g657.t1
MVKHAGVYEQRPCPPCPCPAEACPPCPCPVEACPPCPRAPAACAAAGGEPGASSWDVGTPCESVVGSMQGRVEQLEASLHELEEELSDPCRLIKACAVRDGATADPRRERGAASALSEETARLLSGAASPGTRLTASGNGAGSE